MHPLHTLLPLAVASLTAAAPAPTEPDKRALPDFTAWWLVGYGNPHCKGPVVWTVASSGNACRNLPLLAASYGWAVTQHTVIKAMVEPDACHNQLPVAPIPNVNRVGHNDGRGDWGCLTVPANSISVELLPT